MVGTLIHNCRFIIPKRTFSKQLLCKFKVCVFLFSVLILLLLHGVSAAVCSCSPFKFWPVIYWAFLKRLDSSITFPIECSWQQRTTSYITSSYFYPEHYMHTFLGVGSVKLNRLSSEGIHRYILGSVCVHGCMCLQIWHCFWNCEYVVLTLGIKKIHAFVASLILGAL